MVDAPPPRMTDDTYKEVRASLVQASDDQTKFLDQTNLTLAGGALGLSLTFMHDFVKTPAHPGLLSTGWAFLLASIILTLASVHTSQYSIGSYIRNLDKSAEEMFSVESLKFLKGKWVNISAYITFWLNVLSSASLIIGIAFLAFFAYSNLQSPQGSTVEKPTPTANGILKKGLVPMMPAVPPTPQQTPAQATQPQEAPKK